MNESSVFRLGRAAGRMAKAWLEVVVEFTNGFQQEAGDIEQAIADMVGGKGAASAPAEDRPVGCTCDPKRDTNEFGHHSTCPEAAK